MASLVVGSSLTFVTLILSFRGFFSAWKNNDSRKQRLLFFL
jgi:hypothetical protein